MLVEDLDLARLNHDSPAELAVFLQQSGIPLPVLTAYAGKHRSVTLGTDQPAEAAAEDLTYLFRQAMGVSAYRRLHALPVRVFVGYALAMPAEIPPQVWSVRDLADDWNCRPVGWLAATAGLTPAEYDTTKPDLDTLMTLAALRGAPAGVLAALAEDLR